jgi:hypothetical protein
MAYNNGFPMTYPQMYMPAYQQMQQPQQASQGMTPPTIHAEIIQVGNEQDAWDQTVPAGASQMMIARDESAIFIKSAYPNRQPTLDVYRKEAQKAIPSVSDFITREEFTAAMEALKSAKKAVKSDAKTEAEE